MKYIKGEIKKGVRNVNLYPLGDWHYGSPQCDDVFIKKQIKVIEKDPDAIWFAMGDLMENAIIGSLGDVYRQTLSPEAQMKDICEMLSPISSKGAFMISGNHEQRTVRLVGLTPEQYISANIGVPFANFSCMFGIRFNISGRMIRTFNMYAHHNRGGGYTSGAKINRVEKLRDITPTVDAIFSGHHHITGRQPHTWYQPPASRNVRNVLEKKVGYDYSIGSALTWDGSYAEEKGARPSSTESIRICVTAYHDYGGVKNDGYTSVYNFNQKYEVLTPGNIRELI